MKRVNSQVPLLSPIINAKSMRFIAVMIYLEKLITSLIWIYSAYMCKDQTWFSTPYRFSSMVEYNLMATWDLLQRILQAEK